MYLDRAEIRKTYFNSCPYFRAQKYVVLNFETSLRNKIPVSSNWRGNNILVATREKERETDEERKRKKEKETHAFSEMWLIRDARRFFECDIYSDPRVLRNFSLPDARSVLVRDTAHTYVSHTRYVALYLIARTAYFIFTNIRQRAEPEKLPKSRKVYRFVSAND